MQLLRKKSAFKYTEGALKTSIIERASCGASKLRPPATQLRNGNYKKIQNSIYFPSVKVMSRWILSKVVHEGSMYGTIHGTFMYKIF